MWDIPMTIKQWQMPLSQSVREQGSTAGNNDSLFRMAQCCCRKMPGGLWAPVWRSLTRHLYFFGLGKKQSHRTSERKPIIESYSTKICNENQLESQLQSLWVKWFLSLWMVASDPHGKVGSRFTMWNEDNYKTINVLLPTGKRAGTRRRTKSWVLCRFLWLDEGLWSVNWPGLHILLCKKCLVYSQVSKAQVFKSLLV